jgi:O-antigen/teichoic acid export membrane protein
MAVGGAVGSVLALLELRARVAGMTGGELPAAREGRGTAWSRRRRILVRSVPNGVAAAFGSWYLRIATIVLAWSWSSAVVGEYAAAFRLFEAAYILPAAIMGIGVPHLAAALAAGRAPFVAELRRLARLVLPLAVGTAALLALAGPWIVSLVFTAEYRGAGPVLQGLAWVAGLVCVNYLVTHLMVILDRQRRHAWHEGIAFVTAAVATIVLVPRTGSQGAVTALLVTELVLLGLTLGVLAASWRTAGGGRAAADPASRESAGRDPDGR